MAKIIDFHTVWMMKKGSFSDSSMGFQRDNLHFILSIGLNERIIIWINDSL